MTEQPTERQARTVFTPAAQREVDRLVRARLARHRTQLADARDTARVWEHRARANRAVIAEQRRIITDLLDRIDKVNAP